MKPLQWMFGNVKNTAGKFYYMTSILSLSLLYWLFFRQYEGCRMFNRKETTCSLLGANVVDNTIESWNEWTSDLANNAIIGRRDCPFFYPRDSFSAERQFSQDRSFPVRDGKVSCLQ